LKKVTNNKGIALVTALMLTFISLLIVTSLLYVITRGITTSAHQKEYRTTLEAAYGGVEIVAKDLLPLMMEKFDSTQLEDDLIGSFDSTLNMELLSEDCIKEKLRSNTSDWSTDCKKVTEITATDYDIKFDLSSTTKNPFIVYSKIIDTTKGNTDMSGLELSGSGAAEIGSSVVHPPHNPYLYRIDIMSEQRDNPNAQSNIEVLYAY
jgi:hypothetical protein